MARRFYSHYTFIYPDTYLKNVVVEIDDENRIKKILPFEKEIEKTEFYSGLLIFLQEKANISFLYIIDRLKTQEYKVYTTGKVLCLEKYQIYDENGIIIN